jgi:hypothetical protein
MVTVTLVTGEAGSAHTCAIVPDGDFYRWGDGSSIAFFVDSDAHVRVARWRSRRMVVRSMHLRSHYAAALALLGVLTSCADGTSANPMDAADFCEAYANAFCDGSESCCSESFPTSPIGRSRCSRLVLDYCESSLLTADDLGVAPDGPNTPARIVFDFDEAGAGAAIARVKSSFARCVGSPFVTFGDTHFLGEPGSECLRHEDCYEGMRCEHPPRAVFGTCLFAPLEGQVCSDICAASDLECAEDRGDLICVGPRSEGESCDQAQCKPGLVCVETWDTVGGGGNARCEESGESPQSDRFCADLIVRWPG